MEIKLNVYEGKTVVKTYTANEVTLSFGVVEDVLELIDTKKLAGADDDVALMKEVIKIVTGAFGQVKTILREVFPEITDDELRRTHLNEVAMAVVNIFKFSFAELGKFATSKTKN